MENSLERKVARNKNRGCLVELLIASLLSLLILAAVAIPDFLKFQGKCGASESKCNLRVIFAKQEKYFKKHGVYASHTKDKGCFELIKWKPSGKTIYNYYCDTDVILNKKGYNDCHIAHVPPVTATSFTIYAVGNVDNDPVCDVWTINDAKVIKNVVVDP